MDFKLEDLDNLDEIVYKKDTENNQSKGISNKDVVKELEIISNGMEKIKEDKNTDKVKKQTEKNKEPKIVENDSFTSMTSDEKQALLELFKLTEEKYSNNDGKYDFRQVRNILPIDEWLNDDYYVPFTKYIYPYWKEYIVELFKGQEGKNFELPYNEIVVGGCFTGDTKVSLLSGEELSFIELIEKQKKNEPIWVYSFNRETYKIEAKKASNISKRLLNQKLIKITLDNGTSYKCTLDHRHLTINNEWVQACELKIGDSLMPLYRKYIDNHNVTENNLMKSEFGTNFNDGNYEIFWDIYSGRWHFTHRYIGGYYGRDKHIHHIDFNPKNNNPENLEVLTPKEHLTKHARGFWNSDKGSEEKEIRSNKLSELMYNGLSKQMSDIQWSDPKQYDRIRKFTTERNKEEWFKELTSNCRRFKVRKSIRDEYKSRGLTYQIFMKAFLELNTLEEFSDLIYKYTGEYKARKFDTLFRIFYLDDYREMFRIKKLLSYDKQVKFIYLIDKIIKYRLKKDTELYKHYKNHKIVNIEYLDEREDVYCMEVEDNHNFALSNGIFVSNSIGCGKSTLATILVMRMIYIISCFENIQSLYSLMPGSPLYICIISVNREVAESTLYGDLLTKIDMTPYFQEKFPRNKRINSLIAFPNNLTIMFGSNVNSVIGKNIICFAADEMNFRQGGAEQTNEFYAYLLARNKSRFIYEGGKNGSLAILMSSATTSTSIVEQRKIEALKDKRISTRDPSLWEVKPKSYSKDRFPLFTGSLSCEPQIIKGYQTLKTILKEEGLNISDDIFHKADNIKEEYYNILYVIKDSLPDNIASAIKEVPLELYVDFESNLIYSMQNLAGVAVSPSGRLFTSKRKYNDALDENIPYPFVSNKIVLSTGDDKTILDYLRMDYRNEIKNKEVPRFIHIDGSFAGDTENRKADHTGISCCHISGVRITDSGTKLPLITIDWQLEVVSPKAPNQISFQKVADIVYTMNDIIGINIKDGSVTYDGFQSQYAIQLFNANGYNSFVKSLDRTDLPYIDLINLFYEDRIKLKNHTTSQKELFELIHYRENRKVDHPADGSKDLIDSVCGCVNGAINSEYFANRYLEITNPSNFINADDYLAKLALEEKSKKIEITSDDDIFINQTINKLWKR